MTEDRIKQLEMALHSQKLLYQDLRETAQVHSFQQKKRIEQLETALRKIADIEHEDLPKPSGAAEGTLWSILAGCVEVAEAALEKKDD